MDLGDEAAGARLWWFAPRLARGAARCDDSWTRALCVSLLFPLGFLGLAGVLRLIAMTVGVWEDWVREAARARNGITRNGTAHWSISCYLDDALS